MSEPLKKILRNVRVSFWMCPIESHAREGEMPPPETVRWIDGVAHCTYPGCELTSEITSGTIRMAYEKGLADANKARTLVGLLPDGQEWVLVTVWPDGGGELAFKAPGDRTWGPTSSLQEEKD